MTCSKKNLSKKVSTPPCFKVSSLAGDIAGLFKSAAAFDPKTMLDANIKAGGGGLTPALNRVIDGAKSWFELLNDSIRDKEFIGNAYTFLLATLMHYKVPRGDSVNFSEAINEYELVNKFLREYALQVLEDDTTKRGSILTMLDQYAKLIQSINVEGAKIKNERTLVFNLDDINADVEQIRRGVAADNEYGTPEPDPGEVPNPAENPEPEGRTEQGQQPKPQLTKEDNVSDKIRKPFLANVQTSIRDHIGDIKSNFKGLAEIVDASGMSDTAAAIAGKSFTDSFDREQAARISQKYKSDRVNIDKIIGDTAYEVARDILEAAIFDRFENMSVDQQQQAKKFAGSGGRGPSEKKVAYVFGGRFRQSVANHISKYFRSVASTDHIKKKNEARHKRRMDHPQEQEVFREFYKQVRQYFLSYLNPPQNNVVENLFRAFPTVDSPFERAPHWMEARYREVQQKPDKTEGDRIFLKMYANFGAEQALGAAAGFASGLAAKLKDLTRTHPYKPVPAHQRAEGAPEYERMNDNEVAKTVVDKLMVVVKNAGQQQGTDWEGLMTASSNGIVVVANEQIDLPPIPPPPQDVIDTADEMAAAIRKDEEVQQENRHQTATSVPSGAAFNALAVAAVIFSEVRVAISDADEDALKLRRGEGSEGEQAAPGEAQEPQVPTLPEEDDGKNEPIMLGR